MAGERTRFKPGALFRVPVGDDDFAYAVMLAHEGFIAFYGRDTTFHDGSPPSLAPLFVTMVERGAYTRRGWGPQIGRVGEADLPAIPLLFWQSAANPADCRIVDPVTRRRTTATPADGVGLEPEAIWAQPHLESRIADHYAGRPNAFLESLIANRAR